MTNEFDNDNVEQNEVTNSPAMETQDNKVTMQDGRVVEFPKRARSVKEVVDNADGSFTLKMDFRNGESRDYLIDEGSFLLYAKHGAIQKFGDTFNAEDDTEDAIAELDDMYLRIKRGEWLAKRAAGETKGGSMLVQALVEHLGVEKAKVQDYLSRITPKQKFALGQSSEIKPIIARLKQEKLDRELAKGKVQPKKEAVDTENLLAEIAGL